MSSQQFVLPDIRKRFDGFLPVVVDIETTGVDNKKHGLLEIAACIIGYDQNHQLNIS
jgi:ribonuclease T